MITISINVQRIDKTALFEGKTGKFLNLALRENKDGPDKFGNTGFVVQDIGRERREAGEKGPIIGNWRQMQWKKQASSQPKQTTMEPQDDRGDDIPF
jgi:hypothetical protein